MQLLGYPHGYGNLHLGVDIVLDSSPKSSQVRCATDFGWLKAFKSWDVKTAVFNWCRISQPSTVELEIKLTSNLSLFIYPFAIHS